jgi:hypothetical protein
MEFPRLRNLEAMPVRVGGRDLVCLHDPQGFSPEDVFVPPSVFLIISLFDGRHSLTDIQVSYTRQFGELLLSDRIQSIIRELDERLLLDNERFAERKAQAAREFAAQAVRPLRGRGTGYPTDPQALRRELDGFVYAAREQGARAVEMAGPVRGAVAPHIDFARGGACYGWTYDVLQRACHAERFVILGIAHFGDGAPFVVTRKGFETPLGIVETDAEAVEALQAATDDDLLAEELTHKTEHSIELQAVWLQYAFGRRKLRIVPVLCGSLLELAPSGSPMDNPAVRQLAEGLRQLAELPRTCLLASADLSHVGRRFGDSHSLTPSYLGAVERQDRELLSHAEAGDAEGFYEAVRRDEGKRGICGATAIYLLLQTLAPTEGRLLRYEQAVTRQAETAVTFASMVFT